MRDIAVTVAAIVVTLVAGLWLYNNWGGNGFVPDSSKAGIERRAAPARVYRDEPTGKSCVRGTTYACTRFGQEGTCVCR